MEVYGVECVFQSPEIIEKIRKTHMNKLGFSHHMKTPESREKRDITMIERYGIRYAFHSDNSILKARATCLLLYGAEFPFQSDQIKEYMRQMSMDMFGVEHPMKLASEFQRRMFRRSKPVVFPSGRIDYVAGFEPQCINLLLNNYNEDDIITNQCDIPTIRYIKIGKTGEEKNSVYFPDILVLGLLVEVKSLYTYQADLVNNIRKFEACVSSGHNIEVWIFDNFGKSLVNKILYSSNENGDLLAREMLE
jgi:hypothetical protein